MKLLETWKGAGPGERMTVRWLRINVRRSGGEKHAKGTERRTAALVARFVVRDRTERVCAEEEGG